MFQPLSAPGMTGIQDRHVIPLRHPVYGRKQRSEIFLRVQVFFPVRRQQNIVLFLQPQLMQNIRPPDFGQILMQHLRHGGTGYENPLLGQPALVQIFSGIFAVSQIHVRNDIHDSPVRFLRQALVFAAVSRFHMENGNMKPFRRYGGQTAVGIPQNQQGVRTNASHQLIGSVDNIPYGSAQIIPHGIQIHFRIVQLQIAEKNTV